jgi:hypothetical protein
MARFTFELEHEDGTPADPPVLHTAVPTWHAGDTIPLGRDRILRVIETRPGTEPEGGPVLVVVETALRTVGQPAST